MTHSPEYLEKGSALPVVVFHHDHDDHLIFCSPNLPRSVTGLRHSHNTPDAASAGYWALLLTAETYQLFGMDGEALEETQNMERLQKKAFHV